MALHITGDPVADELLSRDPLSLLVAMLLDQQIPMEKAFSGPALIAARLGSTELDAATIASTDPERFAAVMAGPPAVHRFPKSMGERVQALARYLVEHYDGRAEAIWQDAATGADLLARLRRLPGYGEQKAKIFLALLAKRLQVQPPGWQEAAGDYGAAGYRSVADVVDADSLQKVREHKRAMKARG